MRAAVVHAPGRTPVWDAFDDPSAGEGGELVQMVAAAVHPVVRSVVDGHHYASSAVYPCVPGIDAVARRADGELVYAAATVPPHGTLAELLAPAMMLPLPAGSDAALVAAAMNPGMSSWLPLAQRLDERPESGLGTVAVLGATGIAGRLAVGNAFALGAAHVVAAGRDPEALAAVAGPACTVVRLTGDEAADLDGLAAAYGQHPPSTVLDYVWGAPAAVSLEAVGRSVDAPVVHVQIGDAAGAESALPARVLRGAPVTLRGSGAGSQDRAAILAQLPRLLAHLAAGEIAIPLDVHPLEDIASVWSGERRSRLVLTGPTR